jgi:catechol 2,3-dioxygenase-like lactoylglutathione lyase family enzyme
MIAHISIGARDIDRSTRCYDAVLEPLGYKCLRAARSLVGYASRSGLSRPSIRYQPTKSQVSTSAFAAPDAAAVDAFHTAALLAGLVGATTVRPIYGPDYYAAFIIDPDGYRIEAYYDPGKT